MNKMATSQALLRVAEGWVDLFAEIVKPDGTLTARHHLLQAEGGALVLSGALTLEAGDCVRLSPVPRRGARMAPADSLSLSIADIETWLEQFCRAVGRSAECTPAIDIAVKPGEDVKVGADQPVSSAEGLVWARLSKGQALMMGRIAVSPEVLVPLVPGLWLQPSLATKIAGYTSQELAEAGGLPEALNASHVWLLRSLAQIMAERESGEQGRIIEASRLDGLAVGGTLSTMARVLETHEHVESGPAADPLHAVMSRVAGALGVRLPPAARALARIAGTATALEAMADVAGLRLRRILLRPGWQNDDSAPLICFEAESGAVLAAIPIAGGRYQLYDPRTGATGLLTPQGAAGIQPAALSVSPTLPNRPLRPADLFRFVLPRCKRDLVVVASCGALGGVVSSLVPAATGFIIDKVIPAHNITILVQVALALLMMAFATFAFNVTQDISLVRLEGKVAGLLQPAIVDRLVRLPSGFFRQFNSGDLSQRARVIETLQRMLTGTTIIALITGIFSLYGVAVMFVCDASAGLVALLLLAFLLAVLAFASTRLKEPLNVVEQVGGAVTGMVLQLISGMSRVRLNAAEDRMFVRWGEKFSEVRAAAVTGRRAEIVLKTFFAAYEILCYATLYAILGSKADSLSTGTVLAFMAAFATTLKALLQTANITVSLLRAGPLFTRARPILETVPETRGDGVRPDTIHGQVELSSVGFRYQPDLPPALTGIDMQIPAGSFVAVVGPSGSGKSTLIRLLLGFDRPDSGTIFIDGIDMASLDIQALRRRMGTVLQNSKLFAGTIFDNIRAGGEVSLEDAWTAAAQAGIAADIKALPMGMHTLLKANNSGMSAGQQQRLVLARALAAKPRIILFDDATSVLDNPSNDVVSNSLARLPITRIVVAQRLASVIPADRIVVLENGAVSHAGSFAELQEKSIWFADFVRRQSG